MVNKSSSPAISIEELRSLFPGNVIAPEDAEYDKARTTFYGGIDNHPAVIIRVHNAEEVVRVISLARDSGMELAVRSGGHSVIGHCVSEGGIVLDLSKMCDLQIDVEGCAAWVEPGLTAGEYTKAVGEHGLVTGFGDTGSVGIGGITLGGGVGYLVRKYGLTIDSLLAAEIVTADGEFLRVDDKTNTDLFWAIRGGGGNFGVVTRFQFRLHEVPAAYGGMLFLPATVDSIASFISLAEAAPDSLSTIANVITAPPMPFIPEEYYGKPVIMGMLVYAGDAAEGERTVAPFRAITKPLADMMKPMQYHEIYQPEPEDYHPVGANRTMFVDSIDREVAKTILDYLTSSNAMMAVAQLRVLGGAMARIPDEATAFAHRNSKIMVNVAALYNQPDQKDQHEKWATDFAAALRQSDHGAYVNFLSDDSQESVRAAYPSETLERLAQIKTKYDPTNLFHLNQNIVPATE